MRKRVQRYLRGNCSLLETKALPHHKRYELSTLPIGSWRSEYPSTIGVTTLRVVMKLQPLTVCLNRLPHGSALIPVHMWLFPVIPLKKSRLTSLFPLHKKETILYILL